MTQHLDILLPVHFDHIYLRASLLSVADLLSDTVKLVVVVNGTSCLHLKNVVLDCLHDVPSNYFSILTTEIPGLANALNMGISYSSAQYIARFDSDDICLTNFVSHHLSFLSKYPDILLFTGASVATLNLEGLSCASSPAKLCTKFLRNRNFLFRNPICHPATVFNRDAVIALGGYHEVKYAEDYDLWIRFLLRHPNAIASTGVPVIFYRSKCVSGARGSPYAYIGMAYIQLKMLYDSRQIIWMSAFLISLFKFSYSFLNELFSSRFP